MKKIFTTTLVTLALAMPVAVTLAQDPPPVIGEKDVLDHLESLATWQRNIIAIETDANNSLENVLKDTLQQNAAKALQFGFDFARAEAVAISNQKDEIVTVENPNTSQAQISKVTNEITAQIASIQKEQIALDARIRRTRAALRTPLLIQKERLAGDLKIANARLELIQSAGTLFKSKGGSDSSLTDRINNLAMTLPVLSDKTKKDPAKPVSSISSLLPIPVPTASSDDKAESQKKSRGIIGLTSDVFAEYRRKKEIDLLVVETNNLMDANQSLMDSMRTTLQNAIKHGSDMTAALNSADRAVIEQQRENIDKFIGDYKQLGTAVIPLAQINTWLDASKHNLKDWRDSLDEQIAKILRGLVVQMVLLGIAILIPLIISEAVRRAILNYVHDSKRQRQLNIARRGVVAFIVFIIILLNFVSEFDSLATFAGFLTAGIAVALQNIILSLVAHFFYFGRFGVRVGDRVTIKDITGEVVQVGMVRLYLMELGGPDAELYPTGKIVAFPNSILFQNEAFIKQISGADYTWQEITFLLDPSSDYQLANKKLNEAVNIVYAQYYDVMESQKQAMTRSTHLDVNMPVPKGYLNFTDAGLAFIIRYPIQSDHVTEINQRITSALIEAIGKEPSLKLLSSNPPKIVAVDHE